MQTESKMQTEVLDELLFADNMTKGAPTEEKMQYDGISAITWKALQGAYNHSERSTIADGRQVQLPLKHIV